MNYNQFVLDIFGPEADYLGAAELIEASRKTQLNACHLATIWALDADGDGLVSRRDVEAFFHSVLPQAEHCRDDELQALLQSLCTLRLKQAVATEAGTVAFQGWLIRMLGHSAEPGGAHGLHRNAVAVLHELLNVHQISGHDFQAFFDLLQRAGEEKGLMDLDDEALDDFCAVAVVQQLALATARGMRTAFLPADSAG